MLEQDMDSQEEEEDLLVQNQHQNDKFCFYVVKPQPHKLKGLVLFRLPELVLVIGEMQKTRRNPQPYVRIILYIILYLTHISKITHFVQKNNNKKRFMNMIIK